MVSTKSFIALLASAVATSAVTVTFPASDKYWVYGDSNSIYWTYNNGDPSPVSITITNPGVLSGPFSIAENVQTADQVYTVTNTNVTLTPTTGYIVNFVNSTNPSQIYTSSPSFEVKPAGTLPYGATVFTVVSYSVSGTDTKAVTLVETSFMPAPTPTGVHTSSGTVTAPASSTTSSAAQGAATATAIARPKSSASSIKSSGSLALGLLGVVAGFALLL